MTKVFEQTCYKPYDRHVYKVTLSNGSELLFEDYDTMRNFWFTHNQVGKMLVTVEDVKQKQTKLGFA